MFPSSNPQSSNGEKSNKSRNSNFVRQGLCQKGDSDKML